MMMAMPFSSAANLRFVPPLSISAWLRFDAIAQAHPWVGCSVLEVGAGQGALGVWFARRATRYVAVEPDDLSRDVAQHRLQAFPSAEVRSDLPDGSFDVVCAFEVLEHIDDDQGALRDWAARLRPGGRLVLSVPAHRARYGPADEAVGHHRRYDRHEIVALLTGVGFAVDEPVAYGAGLGHLAEWVRNRLAARQQVGASESVSERSGRSGRWLQPSTRLGEWVRAAIALPARLGQYPFRRTSVGIGWVLVAQKPS